MTLCTSYFRDTTTETQILYQHHSLPGTQVMFGEDVTLTGCLYDFLNNVIPGKTDLEFQSDHANTIPL